METWYLLAIASVFFSGLYAFFQKVVAEKGHNSALSSAYAGVGATLVSIVTLLYFVEDYSYDHIVLSIALAFINGIVYAIATIARTESLKQIDATIFMPLYKIVSPLIAIFAGYIFFFERFSLLEITGLILSMLVPLLLISKSEKNIQKNLFHGLILMIGSAIFGALSAIITKYAADNLDHIFLYVTFTSIVITLFSLLFYVTRIKGNKTFFEPSLIKWGLINGIFQILGFYTIIAAYAQGTLGVVYTINSLYIVIPIVLSIIIYNEHWNARKVFAIILSIAALFFLQ